MANQSVASGILTDYNGNPFLPRTTFSQTFKDDTGVSLANYVWPVKNGGTGKSSLDSGKALIGNGTDAVSLRSITNNTTATAVAASTNLITANTLYYHKGNSNIVNVGTITSGTWQGTDVGLAYGGTGVSLSNNPSMLVNLGSTTAGIVFANSPRPGVTGTLAIGNGGTGATTAANALKNLGLTATATELNVLDGITATTTELNYVDGVTSNIQTQLNGKSPSDHNHDSRYYTEIEIGTIPTGYSSLIDYINSKTSGTATSGNLAALETRVGDLEKKSLLVNLGSTSAVALSNVNQNIGIKGTLPIANGGTGATSITANRVLFVSGNAITTSSHSIDSTKLAINTSQGVTNYNFCVNGSSYFHNGTVNFAGGHLYLRGSSASSSTANTTQLIFGTESTQHIALSANDNALILNPDAATVTNQIVLYLNQASVFPSGLQVGSKLILENTIYGSLDDMNAISSPVEGQVFFVLN